MSALGGASQRHRPAEPRPVVYVVDDDVVAMSLLCEIADDAGWEPHGFANLVDLRRALHAHVPSLILLDDNLPDGRGGDVARELRDDARLAHVPVVVCTAAHPMRQAQINTWAPVVAKPFDLAILDRLLDDARARAGRSSPDRAG